MATPTQRAVSILDALLNNTSSVAQRQRLTAAFGTPENYLGALREFTLNQVKLRENQVAKEATQMAVDTDFPEAP